MRAVKPSSEAFADRNTEFRQPWNMRVAPPWGLMTPQLVEAAPHNVDTARMAALSPTSTATGEDILNAFATLSWQRSQVSQQVFSRSKALA